MRGFVALSIVLAACASSPPPAVEVAPVRSAHAPTPPEVPSVETQRAVLEANAPDIVAMNELAKHGRTRPLGAIAGAFKSYLEGMHGKIHSHYADVELGKLDALSATDARNDPKLSTRILVIVDGATGAIDRVDLVTASREPRFDAIVRDAVLRAGPFDRPAPELLSRDGKTYVLWEIRRDPTFACSTLLSRPFLFE